MAIAPFLDDIFQDPVFSITAILASFGIGIWQGNILGRAIMLRFPKLQSHAKIVSISLFFLFLINALLSVPRFASPEKIQLSALFETTSSADFVSLLFLIFGVNTGFLTVLAFSATIMTIVLLKMTHLKGISKIFVLVFSLLVLGLTILSRFTDLTPSTFEVFLYFLYQLGITIGILVGSARKVKKQF
ncbi:MAG: hypothetical protein R3327_06030 [Nitrosopumilaceae archaeon]|nr:hypothetical protein [Nitrosopumilaceae archaeon]